MNNNDFNTNEILGRNIWFEVLSGSTKTEDIYFTTDPMCHFDVIWRNKDGKKYVGEIKRRKGKYVSTHPLFIKEGFLLEKIKYDALKKMEKKGYIPYMIYLLPDNKAFIANLTDFVPQWIQKGNLPSNNVENDPKRITKWTCSIPMEFGKIIEINYI